MISIIIPTYNAAQYLPNLLENIKSQSLANYELIIIDSSSSDNTLNIAKKYADKIIVIPQKEFDHGGTRAKAAQIAQGEILVFLTQDALPYDEYTIENLVKVFKDTKVGASYGKQISYKDTNLFGKHLREFNYPNQTIIRSMKDRKKFGIKTAQLSNSFSAYKKSILLEIGNFKSNLILGEDVYAGAKIILNGYKLLYTADAKVYHSHSYTVWDEFQRYFDIGVFHKSESWILQSFGKVEGEGLKYIKSELRYLTSYNALHLIPEFIVRNIMKYIGYKLGLHFTKLPNTLVKSFSMHKSWWCKHQQ